MTKRYLNSEKTFVTKVFNEVMVSISLIEYDLIHEKTETKI